MKTMKNKIAIGSTFRWAYADSNPLWRVVRPKGRGVWLCEIVNEPFEYNGRMIDSDWAGTQKAFLSTEIAGSIGLDNMWEKIHNESDKFYSLLKEGQIVHYNNGFKAWVRCKVIKESDKNVLLPIALVGAWGDLPSRRTDGTIYNPYHADNVLKGKTFKTPASNIYEFKKNGDNPTELLPIDLTLPDATKEENDTCELWIKIAKINKLTEGSDPVAILAEIKRIL